MSARALFLVLLGWAGVLVAPGAWADCNLIPVASDELRSVKGTISNTVVAPGNPLRVRVDLACDPGGRGFDALAANNQVVLRFVPPGAVGDPALITEVPVAADSITASNCGLGGGRCDTLRFVVPDAATLDAALAPAGDGLALAGPAEVVVRAPDSEIVAEIGPLFEPTLSCSDEQPEPVFGHLTIVPEPNSFGELAVGSETTVRTTLDGNGNLLIPFDYGDVLPSGAGSALFRILQASANLDAFSASPGVPIRVPAASYVRSFSLSGRPIPPVLEIDGDGALILGSVDARFSIIRLARLDPATNAGPALYDLSDRLSQGGRGPIVVADVVAGVGEIAPLASLSADAAGITFARSEALENLDLNADGDLFDRVAQVVDVGTSASASTGLALTEVTVPGFVKPALVTGAGITALALSEARQDFSNLNADGDAFDALLRVFDTSGNERTATLPETPVDPDPALNGTPLVVSDGLVFFRTREADAAPRSTELLTPTLQNQQQRGDSDSPSVSRDGRIVAFQSFGGPTFLPGAPSGNHIYVLDRETGSYELISRRTDGTPLEPFNSAPNLSADGRFVAFGSLDESFPGAGDGGLLDAFVFDRDTGTLTLISAGRPGYWRPDDISDDGRFVLANKTAIYDRQTDTWIDVLSEVPPPLDLEWESTGDGQTGSMSGDARIVAATVRARILPQFGGSVAFEGVIVFDREASTSTWCGPGTGRPGVSGDGGSVGFQSEEALVVDDNNLAADVYVAAAGNCSPQERVSVDAEGRETSGGLTVRQTELSDDGRYVAFVFDSDGLVPGAPSSRQVYRYDRTTDVVEAVSVDTSGTSFGAGFSNDIAISGDGQLVAFSSFAQNLAPGAFDVQNIFTRGIASAPSLNAADSDLLDIVLQVFDPAAIPPALRPAARVPAEAVAVDGGRAAFLSSEAADGGIDRNGNGSAEDLVARVYDGVTDQLVELGVAANRIDIAGDTVCLSVPESQEPDPAFRNADGDTDDDVLAIWSVAGGGSPTSLGVSAVAVQAVPGSCVFSTREADEGAGVDLNGDGDFADTVLRAHDGTGITETSLAVDDFLAKGSLVGFRVPEDDQGLTPLNGDGDAFESVMHVLDLGTGQVLNTGIAATPCQIPGCDPFFEPYRIGSSAVSFLTREPEQSGFLPGAPLGVDCSPTLIAGECDLDDDGDGNDLLITVFNVQSRQAQVVTLAQDGQPALPQDAPPFPTEQSGKTVLQVTVPESSTGEDVNGDGVVDDTPVLVLIGDTDNDGTLDTDVRGRRDSCVETANPTQEDADRDRLGDAACDPAPTPTLPGDVPCDVDLDGVIDAADVTVVFGDRGMAARASDPRDPDGDGIVSVLDASICSRSCTFADCASAPPEPSGACGLLGVELLPLLGLLGYRRRRARSV